LHQRAQRVELARQIDREHVHGKTRRRGAGHAGYRDFVELDITGRAPRQHFIGAGLVKAIHGGHDLAPGIFCVAWAKLQDAAAVTGSAVNFVADSQFI